MKTKYIFPIVVAVAIIAVISFVVLWTKSYEESRSLEKVTVKLKWEHQAQFAGIYVAKELGYYEEMGLDVEILPFTYENPTIDSVVSGDVEFGVAGSQSLVYARAEGHPVKAFGVIYKTIPDCAYTLASSGITTPYDFVGKTVGLEQEGSIISLYEAMMSNLNIDRSQINEIPIGYDATELLAGETDVSTGYSINEPHQAIQAGYEVNTILFADYGVSMYGDVLFTTDDVIKNRPDLVERFLCATLRGWEHSITNHEDAVAATLLYAQDRTYEHELYMLEQSIPLIHTGESPIGWMDLEGWNRVIEIMDDQQLISSDFPVEDIYTVEFLKCLSNH